MISIHALREESDFRRAAEKMADIEFLSTLSVRRATGTGVDRAVSVSISIHALREESDPHEGWGKGLRGKHFYPRSP